MTTKLSTLLGSTFTGTTGPAGSIQVGTVTTAAIGTPAAVTNVGTEKAAILNFTFPMGASGYSGMSGYSGAQFVGSSGYSGYSGMSGYSGTSVSVGKTIAMSIVFGG
jgi:hypothetical protein